MTQVMLILLGLVAGIFGGMFGIGGSRGAAGTFSSPIPDLSSGALA